MDILISPTPDALNAALADAIVARAKDAIAARGRFSVALTGGSSPQGAYKLLAQSPRKDAIDWQHCFVFMSDERCVPFSDPRSNYGEAQRHFLNYVPLPPTNLLPIETDGGTPEQIADAYAQTLASFFGTDVSSAPPAFDLILLGLGDDGHCASLFPGKPTLNEMHKWVVSSTPGTLPPPVDRVTFTFPLLNAARAVLFVVNGDKKAVVVQDILEKAPPVVQNPAVGVQPSQGTVTWMIDQAAASLLSPDTGTRR